jgi:hypothetical protein
VGSVDALGALGLQIDAAMGRAGFGAAVLGFVATGVTGFAAGTVDGFAAAAAGLSGATSAFGDGATDAVGVGSTEDVPPSPTGTGVRHLRQGTVPFRARRSRTTSSPTVNSVEHTLQRTCMSQNHLPTAGLRRQFCHARQDEAEPFLRHPRAVLPTVNDRTSNCNSAVRRARLTSASFGPEPDGHAPFRLVHLAERARVAERDTGEASG